MGTHLTLGVALSLALGLILAGDRLPCLAQSLHTEDGIWPEANLSGIEDGNWLFSSQAQPVSTRIVSRWGSWKGIRRQPAVWLRDGSWICGGLSIDGAGNVTLANGWLACPRIPAATVRTFVFKPPVSFPRWLELWEQLNSLDGSQDTVWLSQGNRLRGIVRWGDQSSGQLSVESGDNVVALQLDEIVAVAISPALVGPVPEKTTGLTVSLQDGSRMHIRALQATDGNKLRLALDAGISLTSHDDVDEFTTAIRYLQQTSPRAMYLSDQSTASYKHLPESSLHWELGVNKDLYGRPLIVDGGSVDKGLAMHSTSQVAYRWDGSPGKFLAEVQFAEPQSGADASLGSATCRVLLARSGQLETAGQASISRAGTRAPRSAILELDVAGAQLIVLVTGAADMGQLGDHVLWLDARVVQPK